jgi:hypothetical protein
MGHLLTILTGGASIGLALNIGANNSAAEMGSAAPVAAAALSFGLRLAVR